MRQQQVMEKIMNDWVETSQSLFVSESNLGKNSQTALGFRMRKEQQERALKANGCVYAITTWNKEGERKIFWIFRAKHLKNLGKVMKNILTKHNVQDSIESSIVWEL